MNNMIGVPMKIKYQESEIVTDEQFESIREAFGAKATGRSSYLLITRILISTVPSFKEASPCRIQSSIFPPVVC